MIGGHIPLLININGTANVDIKYTWRKEDISFLVKKVIEWWDADKKYLNNDKDGFFGSISEEFTTRFKWLVSIFSNILSKHYVSMNKKEQIEVIRILFEFKDFNLPNLEALASFYEILPKKQKEIYLAIYAKLFAKSSSNVKDSLSGVLKLIRISNKKNNVLIQAIGENIRSLNGKELYEFINVITIVVKDYPELVNTKLLNDIEIGLSNLVSETLILPQDSSEQVSNKLANKSKAALLTVVLYHYYKSKKNNIPEYIIWWKKLCLDINEFSEIRRIWENEENKGA